MKLTRLTARDGIHCSRKALALLALLGLCVAGGGSGCTSKKDDDSSISVLHLFEPDDVKTMDPANAYDSISLEVISSFYETLYQYDYLAEGYQLAPLLAADMPKVSADRLTLTIPIRRGVKFQADSAFKATNGAGRELKAKDFIYGMKRLALPSIESQGWWVLDGRIEGISEFHDKLLKAPKDKVAEVFAEDVPGLKALDDYTLQIKLVKPYPQFRYILTMPFTSPVPEEAIQAHADPKGNLTDHPVGTGPFVMKTWQRGHRIVLERNPDFRPEFYPVEGPASLRREGLLKDAGKKLPFLERITFDIIKEDSPAWLSFLKGDLDLTTIPKDSYSQAVVNRSSLAPELSSKGIKLSMDSGTDFFYISFNMKDAVVGGKNKLLRQAMSAAIDREQFVELFTNGRGRKKTTALPPGIADRPTSPKLKYDFNLAQAKELLKKAGLPEGKGLAVLNFDLRGADGLSRQIGEFFSRQWGAIGIKVNVIPNTFPAYLEKAKIGDLQVSYSAWSMDYPDPENVYQLLYGPNKAPGPNDSNFDHPEMNKLHERMAAMEPGPARAALIQKMEEILQEEVPWAMLYDLTIYQLTQPWIQNYRARSSILNKWKYLRMDPENKKKLKAAK